MFVENKKTFFYFKLEATIPSVILIQYYQVADTLEMKLHSLMFS